MSFQNLFDQEIGPTPPAAVDVDQVIRQQRRKARLRPVLATLAVLAVAAAGTGLVTQYGGGGGGSTTPPLTEGQDPLAGFPEYAEGSRVVAATSAPMAERSLTLTFTPETLDLVLFGRCDDHGLEPAYAVHAELSVGSVATEAALCPTIGVLWEQWPEWDAFWADAGVVAGESATITVTLSKARHQVYATAEELDPPAQGSFAIAVAERVPFEDYPLPPRPETLMPLDGSNEANPSEIVVRADTSTPDQPVERTIAWEGPDTLCSEESGYHVAMQSQTPGSLRLLVNGVEVASQQWWSYQAESYTVRLERGECPHLQPGDQVTLTVEPTHTTGDWQVSIYQ